MNLNTFSKIKIMSASALLFALLISTTASADEKGASTYSQNQMASPEMKKDMADMHQKMADCLRTDKSMQDCHGEMMKDCQGTKAMGHCSMMNKGGMKHGKMKEKK